jgi:hypothetical protein
MPSVGIDTTAEPELLYARSRSWIIVRTDGQRFGAQEVHGAVERLKLWWAKVDDRSTGEVEWEGAVICKLAGTAWLPLIQNAK